MNIVTTWVVLALTNTQIHYGLSEPTVGTQSFPHTALPLHPPIQVAYTLAPYLHTHMYSSIANTSLLLYTFYSPHYGRGVQPARNHKHVKAQCMNLIKLFVSMGIYRYVQSKR